MRSRHVFRLSFLRAALVALLWSAFTLAHAQTAATVTQITGMVAATDAAGHSRVLAMDSAVMPGSVLRTAADSHARLKFVDGTDIVLRPDTEFRIDKFRFAQARPEDDSFAVRLVKGGFRQVTGLLAKRNPHAMDIRAATATIGIRGTDFAVRMCDADCGADTETQPRGAAPEDARTQDDARKQQEADAKKQQDDARKQQADAQADAKKQQDDVRKQQDDARKQQADAKKQQDDARKQQDAKPGAGVYVQVHDGVVSLAQAGAEIVLVKGEVGFADLKNNPPRTIDSPPPILRHDKLLGGAAMQGCSP